MTKGRRLRRKSHSSRPLVMLLAAGAVMIYVGCSALTGSGHRVNPSPPQLTTRTGTASKATSTKPTVPPKALPTTFLIHVPPKDQYPQLPNGCEVTSLAMLMTAAGHPVSKMTLAKQMPKDPTKLRLSSYTNASGQTVHRVVYWGNPNVGFVGSVYQADEGYGIYHGPMFRFLNQLLPGRAEDMTGAPFSAILRHVAQGVPVEAWTTTTFHPTTDWVSWQSPEGIVRATPLEHAVLIVGYAPGFLFINNPLNGKAAQKVPEGPFIQAWRQLGKQAITLKSLSG